MSAVQQIRRFGIVVTALAGIGGLAAAGASGAQGAQVAAGRLRAAAGTSPATGHPGVLPGIGNPHGHFPVPPAGRAVKTGHPDRVIGDGRPAGCTSAAVVRAVAAGGIIRFDCGKKPVTIVMTSTATVPKTRHLVVLDGGGLVTLSGGGKRRILFSDTCRGRLFDR